MCEALPWHKVSPALRAANPLVLFLYDAVKRATPDAGRKIRVGATITCDRQQN
jgi:hypothetical protein